MSEQSEPAPPGRDQPTERGDQSESFEEASKRLARIVAELESGDLPLERSLALFEEGIRLARTAQQRLDSAERRVQELLGVDSRDRPVLRDREREPASGRGRGDGS